MSLYRTYCLVVFLIASLGASGTLSAQFTIPEKPKLQTAVYDYIELLTASQQQQLSSKLKNYADTTSTQIVVAIISSTKGEDISLLGAKWGQEWGIGQADEDNGILILLARDDRTIDINTGYGIEYRLTDLMAERIINRVIIPEFKQGDYYAGLDKGTTAIFSALNGEFTEDRDFGKEVGYNFGWVIILLIFIGFIILISRGRKNDGDNKGKGGGGGSIWDIIILSNAGRTGGFGGGGGFSGGGGFGGGFGGGGFGGGGASGSW
ncbi:TPM domain-containing protein [Altibacter lentus]|uniref:TPM domain-containing protein n=1 Tax=Altibacter lentus TaxID=1223410 RepID=UPI00373FE03B